MLSVFCQKLHPRISTIQLCLDGVCFQICCEKELILLTLCPPYMSSSDWVMLASHEMAFAYALRCLSLEVAALLEKQENCHLLRQHYMIFRATRQYAPENCHFLPFFGGFHIVPPGSISRFQKAPQWLPQFPRWWRWSPGEAPGTVPAIWEVDSLVMKYDEIWLAMEKIHSKFLGLEYFTESCGHKRGWFPLWTMIPRVWEKRVRSF